MAWYQTNIGSSEGSSQKGLSGTFTPNTSATSHISLGFKPSFLCITQGSYSIVMVFNEEINSSKYWYHSTNVIGSVYNLGDTTSSNGLVSIDNDGFTVQKSAITTNWCYFAVE